MYLNAFSTLNSAFRYAERRSGAALGPARLSHSCSRTTPSPVGPASTALPAGAPGAAGRGKLRGEALLSRHGTGDEPEKGQQRWAAGISLHSAVAARRARLTQRLTQPAAREQGARRPLRAAPPPGAPHIPRTGGKGALPRRPSSAQGWTREKRWKGDSELLWARIQMSVSPAPSRGLRALSPPPLRERDRSSPAAPPSLRPPRPELLSRAGSGKEQWGSPRGRRTGKEGTPALAPLLPRGGTQLPAAAEPRPAPGEKEGGGTERGRQVSGHRSAPSHPHRSPPRPGQVRPPGPVTAAVAAESSCAPEPGSPLAPSVAIFPL